LGRLPHSTGHRRSPKSAGPIAIVDYDLGGGLDSVMLARHLRRLGVKVPYMTGYGHEVRLIDRTVVTIANPYNADMLMRAIQRVITSASDEN
jgi:hypothetical protein